MKTPEVLQGALRGDCAAGAAPDADARVCPRRPSRAWLRQAEPRPGI